MQNLPLRLFRSILPGDARFARRPAGSEGVPSIVKGPRSDFLFDVFLLNVLFGSNRFLILLIAVSLIHVSLDVLVRS